MKPRVVLPEAPIDDLGGKLDVGVGDAQGTGMEVQAVGFQGRRGFRINILRSKSPLAGKGPGTDRQRQSTSLDLLMVWTLPEMLFLKRH